MAQAAPEALCILLVEGCDLVIGSARNEQHIAYALHCTSDFITEIQQFISSQLVEDRSCLIKVFSEHHV
jgi:hypothetical protein